MGTKAQTFWHISDIEMKYLFHTINKEITKRNITVDPIISATEYTYIEIQTSAINKYTRLHVCPHF